MSVSLSKYEFENKESKKVTRIRTEVLQEFFSLDDLEKDLTILVKNDVSDLLKKFVLKDPSKYAFKLHENVKLHRDHLILTKYGTLFLVASLIFDALPDHQSVFYDPSEGGTKKIRDDFVYEKH